MKIMHCADWHIGNFKGPEKDGVNLRSLDTRRCLEFMAEYAERECPELVLVSGDIFHTGKTWSDRCCDEVVTAIEIITRLSAAAGQVIVMRGTPNHDGEGQFKVLSAHFSGTGNIHIVMNPEVIQTEYADIAVLPGFDRGVYRAKFPGLGKEEENEVFSQELGKIVMGLRTHCRGDRPAVLMAHYTVPGCNTESGQSQILTQFEPIIPPEALAAADFNLVALGHIHRPQLVSGFDNVYYSGSINANNFNDEGQERGFWIHHAKHGAFGQEGRVFTDSEFVKTPYREFITFRFTDTDITAIIYGHVDEVAMNYWRWNGAVANKIVRVLYECSAEKQKAFNAALLEKVLYEDGAFWVAGVTPERIETSADRTDLSRETDPEANLKAYLEEKGMDPEDIERLILKARPIIDEAMAAETGAAFAGMFVPIEIEVKNYRAYAEEKFSFEDIQFCTINGQNGAGKSSLFMDAIIDCIYEESREGKSTSVKVPWLRNDEGVRSGYISFTFSIGDKVYRITRTRARSGKGTLNLAEMVSGQWEDRSREKSNDTQAEIEKLIGVDSMTFKSCALIMQDQYGLFLQAKKEERMVILSNLLGMGIYDSMEEMAKNQAADYKRRIDGKKQTIKIQSDNILAIGKPDEKLDRCRIELERYEDNLHVKVAERDKNKLLLLNQQEAAERRTKLLASITTLRNKKAATDQNRATQQAIIDSCSIILDSRQEIEGKVAEHSALLERERKLAGESALYSAKKREAEGFARQVASEQMAIDAYRESVKQKENELSWAQPTDQDAVIKENAAEYERQKKLLDEAYVQEREYRAVERQLTQARYDLQQIITQHDSDVNHLQLGEDGLKKKAELLSNVECVDISQAKCGFLVDAISAKQALEVYPRRYAELEKSYGEQASPLKQRIAELEEQLASQPFDAGNVAAVSKRIAELKPYVAKLEAINQRESKIALLKADIQHLQSNILGAEKRLAEAKSKAIETEQERDRYAKVSEEHEQVLSAIAALVPWLEKEKQLPVAEERKITATGRMLELVAEIDNINMEIADKQVEAEKEAMVMCGMEELARTVTSLDEDIVAINSLIKGKQIEIGGLEQQLCEIQRMRQSIADMQEQIADMAEDAADYDTLKLSFSQDGIPHQIIRTILPKLSNTANNILGQMTSGQLGVELVTEKVMKSNSKKEVATLDIFIEEYGKGSLPYLSKSGGEKVKSSLSVILALAEVKATSAGIQFGMLFIDEPPFLDQDGIQAYCDALETIRERYGDIKIMAITHDPTMKARFPQNIDIVKTEQGSKVVF